jgi:hypothetical protein
MIHRTPKRKCGHTSALQGYSHPWLALNSGGIPTDGVRCVNCTPVGDLYPRLPDVTQSLRLVGEVA